MEKYKLDECLGVIGISPLKTHRLKKSTKISAARMKLEQSFEKQKDGCKHLRWKCDGVTH